VFVFRGTTLGLVPWFGFGQESLGVNEAGDRFGAALAAGNFNGDVRDDLAVGAPGEAPGSDPPSGYVFIFRGVATGLSPWKGFGQEGLGMNEANDLFGWSLATGDFDGDLLDDLAVGAPGEAPGADPRGGYVFVHRGSRSGPTPWAGFDQRGLGANEAGDLFGYALAAGDFDGDGLADLGVGAPGEAPGAEPRSGFLFSYRGTAAGLTPWRGLGQGGLGTNENGDRFGDSLAAGDFDGDGRSDVVVGAPGEAPGADPRSGWAFAFRGGEGGLTPWAGFGQAGLGVHEAGDRFGAALASGDFNADGRADLAIGAPGEAPGSDPVSGYVFTFGGSAAGLVAWRGLMQEQ
jgi:hypothetical protein